ncbi:MAG: bifunctional pyr operon transcriptional regulator/uracil phosphoribosyltransferase PyrR [Victivallaceae bacterium]|nr:bifunctional pyr operon transcriptional regulator/uracil phosphoribosyltransferase PyrR [Victivallaceae bacterium]
MAARKEVCTADEVKAAVRKVADDIISEFLSPSSGDFAVIGIHQQGVPLAKRLIAVIEEKTGYSPELALLDISMYRDDIGVRRELPRINETLIPFDMNDKVVILVDDVLSSGRTIRAALDAVTDYGRPRLIRLAVLVNRGNHEYPIGADYVGLALEVPADRKVLVEFDETDGRDGVYTVDWKRYHKANGNN